MLEISSLKASGLILLRILRTATLAPWFAYMLPTPLEDLKVGVRFLIRDRPNVFKLLLFAAALNFVLIGYSGVGFPYTIRTVLGFDATVYGIADGLIGVSGVAGAFIAGLFAVFTVLMVPLAKQFED